VAPSLFVDNRSELRARAAFLGAYEELLGYIDISRFFFLLGNAALGLVGGWLARGGGGGGN